MSTATAQTPTLVDAASVIEAVDLLHEPGSVFECRILNGTTKSDSWRPATFSGYFNDPAKLAAALAEVSSKAAGIYITANPVNPALLARAVNRLKRVDKGSTTGDGDIERRRWLLIDADAERPAGIASSDDEHAAALSRVERIELYLHDRGWPDPVRADSGNGGHLLYRVDLPADDDGLVQRCLEALAAEFNGDGVKVDTSVFNPARIWRLYGALNCKGDHTDERPHRRAQVIASPDGAAQVVPVELLHELAGLAESEPAPQANGEHRNGTEFDVAAFIARNGFDVTGPNPWKGTGQIWEFNTSPQCEHGGDGPYIGQQPNGPIVAGCPHNSCGWGWADLRARFEPKPEKVFDGDKYYEADSPQGKAAKARQAEPSDTTAMFSAWAASIINRERPVLYQWAPYGSRLGTLKIGEKQVTLIGAPPGNGKTVLAGQIKFDALRAAGQEQLKALNANVEMGPQALLDRQLARLTGIGHNYIQYRDYDPTALPRIQAGIEELRALMPRVEFMSPPFTLERLTERADDFEANIVVVDYAQRFDHAHRSNDQRAQANAVMECCRRLADSGRAVIVISAVNRNGYGKDASLSSFRESSELEYGADSAYLLIRHETDPRTVTLKCVKNRHGASEDVRLIFDGAGQQFTEDPAEFAWPS